MKQLIAILFVLITCATANAQVSLIERKYDEFTGNTTWLGPWVSYTIGEYYITFQTMSIKIGNEFYRSIIVDVYGSTRRYRTNTAYALIAGTRHSFQMDEVSFNWEGSTYMQRLSIYIDRRLTHPTRIRIGVDSYDLPKNMVDEINHMMGLR
jgi:hypothetical protein